MKNLFLPIVHTSAQSIKSAIVGFALLAIGSATASAQVSANALPAVTAPVDLTDVKWKAAPEYAAAVAAERAIAAQNINTPGITAAELALYTGYDLMLGYMEADLATDLPLGEIANTNFKRVSNEAASNPSIQDMVIADFRSLYTALVPKLTQ